MAFGNFDLSGLLTEEEQKKLFEEPEVGTQQDGGDDNPDDGGDDNPEDIENEVPAEEDNDDSPEGVGGDDNPEEEEDTGDPKEAGSSPSVYRSLASALKNDGILPDFEDSELENINTADDFAEFMQKAVEKMSDERVNRVNKLLNQGVEPDAIREYEGAIEYLNSIDEDAIKDETEKGVALRRKLIFNDLMSRGYSKDKALRELEKSFKSDSDIEDATDALEALKSYYNGEYTKLQQDAQRRDEEAQKTQKKQISDFKKMMLEDDVKVGETKLDKKTCQRVYDAVMVPTYKDPETGNLLTQVQRFQKENPLEFAKQLGLWFILTEGGKNFTGFTKEQLRKAKNKSIRELEQKINATSTRLDGSLKMNHTSGGDEDPLLSDDWKIGWAK